MQPGIGFGTAPRPYSIFRFRFSKVSGDLSISGTISALFTRTNAVNGTLTITSVINSQAAAIGTLSGSLSIVGTLIANNPFRTMSGNLSITGSVNAAVAFGDDFSNDFA